MKSLSPKQSEALRLIAESRIYPDFLREEDGWHARWRGLGADNPWIDEYVRAAAMTPLSADAEDQDHETLHDAWLMALRSRTGLVRWDEAECAAFASELREWNGAAEDDVAARAAIAFELVTGCGERHDGFEIRCTSPKGRRGLRALGQSAFVFGPLRSLRTDPTDGRLAVALSRAEAESFLRSGAHDLDAAGYTVTGCDLAASVAAEIDLRQDGADNPEQHQPITGKLVVRVAGEVVSAEEIRFLLEQKSTLVFFRDRWIEVDRNVLKEALRALEKSDSKTLSANEAIGFASGIGAVGRLEVAEARAHGWLRGLVNELRASLAARGERTPAPAGPVPGLAGELRPYQRRGVAWIRFLTDHGFGALLADDMGGYFQC